MLFIVELGGAFNVATTTPSMNTLHIYLTLKLLATILAGMPSAYATISLYAGISLPVSIFP